MNTSWTPRRVDGVVVEVAGDDLFVFNPSDEMMHALNESAAAVLEACDGERTMGDIADELADDGLTVEMVQLGLAELRDVGLVAFEADVETPSRRELLIKLGVGAAAVAAIPVVESIIAPKAAAASSAPSPSPSPAPSPSPSPSPTPTPTPTPTPCSSTWDKSHIGDATLDCDTGIATITNLGNGAGTCPVEYCIFYDRRWNPKWGRILKSGTIPPLGAPGSTGTLDISSVIAAQGKGKYRVWWSQHPDHPRWRRPAWSNVCRKK